MLSFLCVMRAQYVRFYLNGIWDLVWDLFGIYLGSIWDLRASLGLGFEGGPCSVRLVLDATACHAVPVRKKPVCQIGRCYNHVLITQATI